MPLKLSGERPPEIPKKLAETEGWKKLQAEDDKLNKDYQDIENSLQKTEESLKELRAKKDSGEKERNELGKKESQKLQLKQEQASVKEKIETLEQEMVGVWVKWKQENPEPPVPEPTQPAGNKPSVPNKEEEKP